MFVWALKIEQMRYIHKGLYGVNKGRQTNQKTMKSQKLCICCMQTLMIVPRKGEDTNINDRTKKRWRYKH